MTDFDLQRMLLKKEVRFVFLIFSFLSELHRSSNFTTSFFAEIVSSALRFKSLMQAKRAMPTTFKQWQLEGGSVTIAPLSQGVFDVTLYAIVLQFAIAKSIQGILNGPAVVLEWDTLLTKFFNEQNVSLSEISLKLVEEIQSSVPMTKDQVVLFLTRVRHTSPAFSFEKVKKLITLLRVNDLVHEHACAIAAPVIKVLLKHLTSIEKDEKQLK